MSNLVTIDTIVDALAEQELGSKTQLKATVKAVVDSITESLVKGDQVRINGLGTFKVKDRAARTGRNPQTGEALEIAASKAVGFTVAKGLKDAVKGS